jgi:hypothetical protein
VPVAVAGLDPGGVGLPGASGFHAAASLSNDFILFSKYGVRPELDDPEGVLRRHKMRLDAWHGRRDVQKEWFRRTGLDVINRRRGDLMAGKRRIERELMALMIGPDRTATDA